MKRTSKAQDGSPVKGRVWQLVRLVGISALASKVGKHTRRLDAKLYRRRVVERGTLQECCELILLCLKLSSGRAGVRLIAQPTTWRSKGWTHQALAEGDGQATRLNNVPCLTA